MPFDEKLAARVRRILDRDDVEEKRMMGGLTFMVGGHMCCGITGSELMLRLEAEGAAEALVEPYVRPMDFTGKPLRAFVFVAAKGFADDGALRAWIHRALRFAETLPSP
jgi:TfoX/Sxy family transcriptional regulator of competence genes